jgi:hypothetical protein
MIHSTPNSVALTEIFDWLSDVTKVDWKNISLHNSPSFKNLKIKFKLEFFKFKFFKSSQPLQMYQPETVTGSGAHTPQQRSGHNGGSGSDDTWR